MSWRRACCLLALTILLPADGAAQPPLRHVSSQQQDAAHRARSPLPLAAGGYCVVALRDQQQWLRGDPRWAVQFDGRHYLFSGPRERDVFFAAPVAYAPVLGGDCPVTLVETGRRTEGKVEFGVVQGGRLYFFASDEARARFVAEPDRFANADLADGGKCIVSRVEYRRDVAGLPETAVLVDGLRRLFAGAYEQRLYLQQPARYDAASSAPPAASATLVGDGTPPAIGVGWRAADLGTSMEGDDAAALPSGRSPGGHPGGEPQLNAEPVMGGYCPVTLKTRGAWIRGRYDNRAEIGDLLFFTAGPAEREALLADPADFIPALGGDCVVSRVDLGEKVRGSAFHAAEYQGRLYFFADAQRKEAFRSQPQRYASFDVAAGGACVVTLKDRGATTPGFAEFAAWHDGLLYRFAGPDEKAKFLANPDSYAVEPAPSLAPQPTVAQ